MQKPETPHESFLEIMRDALARPELSFEEAIEQPLARTLYATLSRGSAPSKNPSPIPPRLSSFGESRAVIGAAIQDTYLPEELKLTQGERAVLLACSDVVMLNGQRRLRLTDMARAEFLAAVRSTPLYLQVLQEAVFTDRGDFNAISNDPVRLPTAWLRSFLANDYGSLNAASAPLKELSAARAARERLRLVDFLDPSVPSIADLDRRVALGELLEPLRLLIGAEGGWEGVPRSDRFVGRDAEIRNLRSFVNELSSQSLGEFVSRAAAKVGDAIRLNSKPNLRVVQGDGGLGKSALLAKFILDHALDQKRPFPFAYLDFDRATLDPQSPQLLLIEIARQIGLQFPDARTEFAALSQAIRNYRAQDTRSTSTTRSIADPYSRFTEILREYVTSGGQAFLLVMDSIEVVQWNPAAISMLASMVQEFRLKGLVELRAVASGRADVPELRLAAGVLGPEDNIQLLPLSVEEATSMAEQLGRAALGKDWRSRWSRAIVGGAPTGLFQTIKRALSPREDIRREPLTVRVAVDLVLQAEPRNRAEIVEDIRSMSDDGQNSLAGRLYEKRIVNHVRDPKAKKLAWPGLVLRRVSLKIAEEMLAPLCDLAPEDVSDAFESLAKEVWMVFRDGDILRHRPDLRARTLPLMRGNNPETFDKVARTAVDYFARSATTNDDDCAEWIYHRLQIGESVRTVAADVRPGILPKLAAAEQDFAINSEASSYLASRTATTRLSPSRIGKFAVDDALYHLIQTSPSVFGLDDTSIDRVALDVSQRLGNGPDAFTLDLDPWAEALWVKTGAWRKTEPSLLRGRHLPAPLGRLRLYWLARLSPTLPTWVCEELLYDYLHAGVNSKNEDIGLPAAIQAMSLARVGQSQAFADLDEQAARILTDAKPNPLPSMQAALRTAIVLGNASRQPALNLWILGRRRGNEPRLQALTFSAAELRELARIDPDISTLLERTNQRDGRPLRYSDESLIAQVMSSLEQFLSRPLDNTGNWGRGLARIFACRDEDWIIPFGYAVDRATGGKYVAILRSRIEDYFESKHTRSESSEGSWTDMLGATRIADEAGDLAGFARFVTELTDPSSPETAELMALLNYRQNWSQKVLSFLDRGNESVSPDVESRGENPPAPGRVINKEDPQRGRWGGMSEREGRLLRAVLESVEKDAFYFSLVVESTDGSVLEAPVIFHLHDTFPRSVIHVQRIVDKKRAELSDWNGSGVFTVGAQVKDRNQSWTSLELNLATLPGMPKRFQDR